MEEQEEEEDTREVQKKKCKRAKMKYFDGDKQKAHSMQETSSRATSVINFCVSWHANARSGRFSATGGGR